MNLSEIDTKVSRLTKADTNDYSAANRLIDANMWNQRVVTWIIASQDSSDFDDANHSGYATLHKDLVADQRDYKFGISDGVIGVKRVDVSYDATKTYRSTPIDSSEIGIGLQEDYTEVDNYFDKTSPGHDWKYNALFLFPKPTETVGTVEVEVSRTAKDFTSAQYTAGTATPGFDENFHYLIPLGMAYEYCLENEMWNKVNEYKQQIADGRASIKVQYGKKEQDYPLRFSSVVEEDIYS